MFCDSTRSAYKYGERTAHANGSGSFALERPTSVSVKRGENGLLIILMVCLYNSCKLCVRLEKRQQSKLNNEILYVFGCLGFSMLDMFAALSRSNGSLQFLLAKGGRHAGRERENNLKTSVYQCQVWLKPA